MFRATLRAAKSTAPFPPTLAGKWLSLLQFRGPSLRQAALTMQSDSEDHLPTVEAPKFAVQALKAPSVQVFRSALELPIMIPQVAAEVALLALRARRSSAPSHRKVHLLKLIPPSSP